jgi:hypothetical protein
MRIRNARASFCRVLVLTGLFFSPLVLSSQSPGVAGGPAFGGCPAPQIAGVVLCQPPSFYNTGGVTSPFQVIASGSSSTAPVQLMELWVDGKNIAQVGGSLFDKAVHLGLGTHQITAVERDAFGFYLKAAPFTVDVGGSNDSSYCPPPDKPGVHLCAPQQEGCLLQPWTPILAGGRGASGTVSRMELVLNGVILAYFPGDQVNTGLALMSGDQLTIIEVDSKGNSTQSGVITIPVPC